MNLSSFSPGRTAARRSTITRGAALFLAAVVTLTAVGTVRPPAAEAVALRGCRTSAPYEVCFTEPTGQPNAQDSTIVNRVSALLRATSSGDIVRIAMYTWDLPAPADEVVAAHRRGVDIRVVIDGSDVNKATMEKFTGAGVPMHVCFAGCMGSTINHNKFLLFDYGTNVSVVQTSSNLTKGMLGYKNNLVKVDNDSQLYDFYRDYWNRLNHSSWTYEGATWSNSDRERDGSSGTHGYVFPRTDTDPILSVLNNVTCTGGGHIWVAMSAFAVSRVKVRDRLAYLEDRGGCDVKVVVLHIEQEKWVQEETSQGYNLGDGNVRRAMLHHKFMLIDGQYKGTQMRLVFTGSHNFDISSLEKQDEAIMRIRNPFVYDQFSQHFTQVFAEAEG